MRVLFIVFYSLAIWTSSFTQSLISGRVFSKVDKEPLIGAAVLNVNDKNGVATNHLGQFKIKVSNNKENTIIISYLGYVADTFALDGNSYFEVFLDENIEVLANVEIVADKQKWSVENIGKLSMSQAQIVKHMNYLLGEADVLKTLQILPGVSSGNEGTAGLLVRGGSIDQNLYLVDNIEIINPTHLGGFFSALDVDLVNNVNIEKGGFSSKFNGRASSIIDIKLKNGNAQKWKNKFSIGTLSAKYYIEGPIKNDKTTMLLNVRRSIIDLAYRGFNKIDGSNEPSGFSIYDINAKINHRINKNNELSFLYYLSNDQYNLSIKSDNDILKSITKYGIAWGNNMYGVSHNYIKPTLNINTTLSYDSYFYKIKSDYDYEVKGSKDKGQELININSLLNNYTLKTNVYKYINEKNSLQFGGSIKHQKSEPSIFYEEIVNSKIKDKFSLDSLNTNGTIFSLYGELDKKFKYDISLIGGLNFSIYKSAGEKPFTYLLPRLKVNKEFSKINAFVSYARMTQFTHLLSSNGNGFPSDSWIAANEIAPPIISNQVSLGLTPKLNKSFELTIEAFAKTLNNLVTYKEGSLVDNISVNWENTIVTNGTAKIIGLEIYSKSNFKNLEIIVSYDLSKNMNQYANLNYGKSFPSKFDRRHEISIAPSYKFNKKVSANLLWTYNSGQKLTIPFHYYNVVARGYSQNAEIPGYTQQIAEYYTSINNYAAPSYHRLDLNFSFYKKLRKGSRIFNLGIYNAYNRLNPYLLYLKKKGNEVVLSQFGLFPILPSLSYLRNFNN